LISFPNNKDQNDIFDGWKRTRDESKHKLIQVRVEDPLSYGLWETTLK